MHARGVLRCREECNGMFSGTDDDSCPREGPILWDVATCSLGSSRRGEAGARGSHAPAEQGVGSRRTLGKSTQCCFPTCQNVTCGLIGDAWSWFASGVALPVTDPKQCWLHAQPDHCIHGSKHALMRVHIMAQMGVSCAGPGRAAEAAAGSHGGAEARGRDACAGAEEARGGGGFQQPLECTRLHAGHS